MASFQDWLEGARLRTLPAAVAPVFIGVGAALNLGGASVGKSLLAFGVALALQVGVNFANDYSDGKRGTDEVRLGPTRLTASGLVPPKTVLAMALACFGLAAVLGLALIAWSGQWWMLGVGVAAVAAAWFYTGGSHPYGYMGVGLSEAFVFIFFGLVATIGTTYVQSFEAPWWLWLGASGIGLVSIALLMVNNVRDIPTDSEVGKRTVAVRLGDGLSRKLYVALIVSSIILGTAAVSGANARLVGDGLLLWGPAIFAVAASAGAVPGARGVLSGAGGKDLLPALRNTGLFALAYGIGLGALFAFGAGTLI